MRVNQEKIEKKIVELCLDSKVDEIQQYLKALIVGSYNYGSPEEEILKAVGKLTISSKEKERLIDQIIKLYNPRMHYCFAEIIAYSLEYNNDVDVSLMSKYGMADEIVGGQFILKFLFQTKRFDLLDVLIEKHSSSILNNVFDLQYYDNDSNDVIEYIVKKRIVPLKSNSLIKAREIYLYGENCTRYAIKDLSQVKINDLSVEEFINSNEQFIESINVVRTSQFIEDRHHDRGKAMFIKNNICGFDVVLDDETRIEYKINWLSDHYYGPDFLQRCYKEKGRYIWSYDNRFISNNVFNSFGFEEMIKYSERLDYNHKITTDDLLRIKNLSLSLDVGMLLDDLKKLTEDLSKITKLNKLKVRLEGSSEFDEIKTFDVASLQKLTQVKKIEFLIREDSVTLLGLEMLARKGIKVNVFEDFFQANGSSVPNAHFVMNAFENKKGKLKIEFY